LVGTDDDMVGSGLVPSLARPGGNLTGISFMATELDGKRLEILMELVPASHHMAALADPTSTGRPQLEALQGAAASRRVELSIYPIPRPRGDRSSSRRSAGRRRHGAQRAGVIPTLSQSQNHIGSERHAATSCDLPMA
jgi:putative ABC transport system substrate-binding protein